MRSVGVGEGDIAEAARKSGIPGLTYVHEAILERSGEISARGSP